MSPHPDPLPALMYPYCFSIAGRGNGRGAMPFLMSYALEHDIVTMAWVDNASVQFPLNIKQRKGLVIGNSTSSALQRQRLAAIDANAAVHGGQFYCRSAFADFGIKSLTDGKMLFGLKRKIAADSSIQCFR